MIWNSASENETPELTKESGSESKTLARIVTKKTGKKTARLDYIDGAKEIINDSLLWLKKHE